MRLVILAAAAAVAFGSPASAAKLKFSPETFQILGGMNTPQSYRTYKRPNYAGKRTIEFASTLAPGSILVRTHQRKLYYILPSGKAIEYGVGVGRDGFTWSGTNVVSRKKEWPDWRPPPEMIKREEAKGHYIPDYMPGGPNNPLGARALYIGDTEFRIHGTAQPWSIGLAVSSGCIRLLNEEVIDLYNRVKIGATVVVE